jgi:hypothetical protein
MNITVKSFNDPNSRAYDIGRLDFDCGLQVEGGNIWFSDLKGVPANGEYELISRNSFIHLKVETYSHASCMENQRKFRVLQRLS